MTVFLWPCLPRWRVALMTRGSKHLWHVYELLPRYATRHHRWQSSSCVCVVISVMKHNEWNRCLSQICFEYDFILWLMIYGQIYDGLSEKFNSKTKCMCNLSSNSEFHFVFRCFGIGTMKVTEIKTGYWGLLASKVEKCKLKFLELPKRGKHRITLENGVTWIRLKLETVHTLVENHINMGQTCAG
jgi:hypothetical protein